MELILLPEREANQLAPAAQVLPLTGVI